MNKPAISPKHRYPSGDHIIAQREPRRETPHEARSVVRAQREKLGATEKTYTDQKWESPLGLMRQWAVDARSISFGLSMEQHAALIEYVRGRHLARWAKGYGPEHPKSLGIDTIGGKSLAEDPDDETITRLTRAHNGARSAILEYQGRGVEWLKLLDKLARDEHGEAYWKPLLGEVRSAANILVRHYRL